MKYLCENLFDEATICRVVLCWMNQFSNLTNNRAVRDVRYLNDGVLMFKILNFLSPKFFNLSLINSFANTTSSKVANIERIQRCLDTFFKQTLQVDISHLNQKINPTNIAQARQIQDFVLLFELILMCVIKCEKQQMAIEKMEVLSSDDKDILVKILEHVMEECDFFEENNNSSGNVNNMDDSYQYSNNHARNSVNHGYSMRNEKNNNGNNNNSNNNNFGFGNSNFHTLSTVPETPITTKSKSKYGGFDSNNNNNNNNGSGHNISPFQLLSQRKFNVHSRGNKNCTPFPMQSSIMNNNGKANNETEGFPNEFNGFADFGASRTSVISAFPSNNSNGNNSNNSKNHNNNNMGGFGANSGNSLISNQDLLLPTHLDSPKTSIDTVNKLKNKLDFNSYQRTVNRNSNNGFMSGFNSNHSNDNSNTMDKQEREMLLNQFENENNKLMKENENLKNEMNNLKETYKNSFEENRKDLQKQYQDQISMLVNELDACKNENEQLMKEKENLQNNYNKNKTILKELQAETQQYYNKYLEYKDKCKQLYETQMNNNGNNNHTNNNNKNGMMNSMKEKEYLDKIESLNFENRKLTEKYKILCEHYEKETKKTEELKNTIIKYENNSKQMESNFEHKYSQRLKNQLNNLESTIEGKDKQIEIIGSMLYDSVWDNSKKEHALTSNSSHDNGNVLTQNNDFNNRVKTSQMHSMYSNNNNGTNNPRLRNNFFVEKENVSNENNSNNNNNNGFKPNSKSSILDKRSSIKSLEFGSFGNHHKHASTNINNIRNIHSSNSNRFSTGSDTSNGGRKYGNFQRNDDSNNNNNNNNNDNNGINNDFASGFGSNTNRFGKLNKNTSNTSNAFSGFDTNSSSLTGFDNNTNNTNNNNINNNFKLKSQKPRFKRF